MRIKVFELIGSLLYSIYRAEDSHGRGNGRLKLETVKDESQKKAIQLRLIVGPGVTFSPKLISLIVELIEIIVAILNLIGVFTPKDNRKSDSEARLDS